MNWIDIVILVIIVWFGYKGFKNGLVWELTSFISLILAIWVSLKYSYFTQELLIKHLSLQGSYIPFLSFVITFLLVLILVGLVAKLITKILNIVHLGVLNKLLGLVFALLKVGLILSLFINGIDRINKNTQFIDNKTITESKLYTPLNDFSQKIYKFCDANFDHISKKIKEITE